MSLTKEGTLLDQAELDRIDKRIRCGYSGVSRPFVAALKDVKWLRAHLKMLLLKEREDT